jgi:hypothetical protein
MEPLAVAALVAVFKIVVPVLLSLFAAKTAGSAVPVAVAPAVRTMAAGFGRLLATAAATAAATAIAPAAEAATSAGIAALSAALTSPPHVEPGPFLNDFIPATPEAMRAYHKAVADWEHEQHEWNAKVPAFSGFEHLFSEPRPRQPVGTYQSPIDDL